MRRIFSSYWPILVYAGLMVSVRALLVWMAATGNVPSLPGFGNPSEDRASLDGEDVYVVYFDEDTTEFERRNAIEEVPRVNFLQDGLLPGVSLVRVEGELSPALAALNALPRVSLVLKVTPQMICH